MLNGRWAERKTGSAEDDLNVRPPGQKATSTDGILNGRQFKFEFKWKANSTEDDLNGRQLQRKGTSRETTSSTKDDLNGI